MAVVFPKRKIINETRSSEFLRYERYTRSLDFAAEQLERTLARCPDYFPIYTQAGRWRHSGELWTDWTGGFLAGMLWIMARRHGEPWRTRAEHYSTLLAPRQFDRRVHDLGFIFLNSYLPWFQATCDPAHRDVVIQAGRTLALRFQKKGEYLCSFIGPQSLFVDIMMNVPVIYYAAEATGDAALRQIADAHCRTTARHLVRPDGSTAHEGIFDETTGEFLRQSTHQGLAADSAWARGLAWSLYGFTQVFRATQQPEFLAVARRNADYWLAHLPTDGVPLWDFCADASAPAPWGAQKESSAAAIAASGLLDLAAAVEAFDPAEAERSAAYRQTALHTLDALCTPEYLAAGRPDWEGVLMHGVYHTAKNLGVDESVMWGDFFFVEALEKALKRDA